MIACACIKNSSSSSSKNPILKTSKKLKPCKSCRGKILVDDQTSPQPQGNMVSNNRGFQLLKSIDPQLKWKNGRQRAARRARTLYIWSNINKWSNLNFSYNKNKDSLSIEEDMLISESEKVGVSILGRRFRHTSGHTPPKKRKILVHTSFTSPHRSSSNSDDLGYAMLKRKQNSLHVNLGSLLEGREKDVCIADFSGISILADAACDIDLGFASSDVQESLKENDEIILSAKPKGNDLPMPQIPEDLFGKADIPSDASCLSMLHGKRLMNEVKSNESVKSSQNISCKTMEFASNRISLPLDLNTVIDESFEHETIYSESKDTICGEINENSEHLISRLKFREPKDLHCESKIVESREIKTHDKLKAQRDSDLAGCGSIEESKKCTTVSAISMDAEVVCLKNGTCKQTPLIEDQNTAVFQIAKNSVLLSEFDKEEEKAEATSVPFQLEVDTKTTSPCLASSDHVLTHFHSGMDNGYISVKGSSSTDQESFCARSSSHFEEYPESFGKHNNFDYETSMKNNFDTTVGANVDAAKSDLSMRVRMDLGNCIEGHNSDVNQANGMEKLEFLSDDDSQYEDGELREPLTNCWFDGVEGDDAGTMDNGSDKDKDTYNDTLELPSVPMHTSNDMGIPNDASNTRNHILENNHGQKKLYSPNSYSKMSRWNRVPRRCTDSVNNVSKYHDQCNLDPSRASQAFNSIVRVKSSFGRDNDNFKDRRSRSMERNGFNPHVEKHKEGPQQRNFSYLHSHNNGRSDYRGRFSPKYHGRNRLDSSTYSHPRNAVAAKIANIQRNGFIVAPDGTIIKAKASSYRDTVGRGAPLDRERKYGTGFRNYRAVSPDRPALSNVGRYSHGEDAITSSSSMHQSNRRYHAPSPSRSQFHLSSSPSRSRMHSPHRWVSPRGKTDLSSSSSKSPDFVNTRPRASRPSSDFGGCAVNHGSLPHASRWIDERNDSNHFREHRFERQGNRFESVHYHGRGKLGGYTRSINNGRFRDDDDIREQQRQPTKNGYVKRQWYDDENGFLGHDTCQKSSDVQRRDGPRVLD